jgi:ribosomal protein S18 acetylase RimI-like enzyme
MHSVPMPTLEEVGPHNAADFKYARLKALQDAPIAFGSTYKTESQLSDDDWLRRAAAWKSDTSTAYLAINNNETCGIVAGFVDENDPLKVHLVSMWVEPSHRRTGVGGALVCAVCVWAQARGARTLLLTVTSSNLGAIEFYRRNGFSMTGNTEPYPNDADLIEYEMARPLTEESHSTANGKDEEHTGRTL